MRKVQRSPLVTQLTALEPFYRYTTVSSARVDSQTTFQRKLIDILSKIVLRDYKLQMHKLKRHKKKNEVHSTQNENLYLLIKANLVMSYSQESA